MSPAARSAFVSQACRGDTVLTAEVLSLLACHVEGDEPVTGWFSGPAPEPLPERIGPYRVLELVGQGGMGVVYRARTPVDDDTAPVVALKVLRPGFVTSQRERRFEREIEALRRLDHPGVARLFDAGAADGIVYLATEFIDGVSLTRWRVEVDPPLADRLRVLAELCDAVQCAHEQGVIHRDLKPENILVTNDGHVKVIDFGIAQLKDGEVPLETLATQTWQLMGTILYMSPEQAAGGGAAIDARSDIYALGVIAFELLTGYVPYNLSRLSTPRALLEITTAEPGRLGDLDSSLDLIVRHALEKAPGRRYQAAAAMADDLRRHLAGQPISLRRPGPLARWRRALRARPRLRRLTLATGIAALAVVATLVVTRSVTTYAPVTWESFYARLVEGDRLNQSGPTTRENFAAAANLFRQAHADLLHLPKTAYSVDLSRYIHWRLGEVYHAIGELNHDTEVLEQAHSYWEDAAALPWTPGTALGIPREVPIRARVLRLGAHVAAGGEGLVWTGMGRLRLPVTNFRAALAEDRVALAALAEGDRNYHDPDLPPADRAEDMAHMLVQYGSALTSLGALVDSTSLVEQGLASLRRAESTGALRESAARSLLQETFGAGYLRLAGWSHEPATMEAFLDSALVRLDRARDLRGVEAGRGYWRLRLLRGNIWTVRAEIAPDDIEAARRLRLSREETLMSYAPLRVGIDDMERAVSDATLASTVAHIAALTRDRQGFARADSLLGCARPVLTGDRFPVRFGELELQEAVVARLRWESFGDAADSLAAAKAFVRVGGAVTRAEWPSLHRWIASEQELLAPIGR